MNHRSLRSIYLIRFSTILFLTIILLLLTIVSINYGSTNPLIYRYRLIRTVSVVLTGIVIGFAASYLQGCLRNPLVDHYIVGIGSGALFATYLTLLFTANTALYLTSLNAVIGGLITLFLTITLAEYLGGSDTAYVLVGIGVNSVFSGLSILISYMIISRLSIPPILMLTGSFINSSVRNIPYLITALSLIVLTYPFLSKPLNTLLLGDIYTKQLGYNPRIFRLISVAVAGISTSIVVSIHGLIGFVGLMSPHISRLLLKTSDHRFTTPLSGVVSSTILLATDSLSRIFFTKYVGEIPAGAIASIIGAPFFISLLISRFRAGRID
ncbi:MAG: iron ABC transporter permease [Desulfurococcaceae archaeon]